MARPVIALLTDFGMRDHYVAAMKGVVLRIAPDTALVDITHEIPPQDVVGGALELAACYRDFPDGTIFLVVVDPGVGTRRRAIAAASGAYRFVGPDNGVLAPALDPRDATVVELSEPRFAQPRISHTFEGRDRFAPAAAWLARGTDLLAFGPVLGSFEPLALPTPQITESTIIGEVVRVDRFGNLVSNIEWRLIETRVGSKPAIDVGGHAVQQIVRTYGEAARGEACALEGSGGYLEVATPGGSAATLLGVGRGARVVVRWDRLRVPSSTFDTQNRTA